MKTIIDVKTQKTILFSANDPPLLIHGKEHTGSSLFSVVIASQLHEKGNKLLIFTAYDMARDEFLANISNSKSVYCLENKDSIKEAAQFQTIIIKSGDIKLCLSVFQSLGDIKERIFFLKNFESILTDEIIENSGKAKNLILSGNGDISSFKIWVKGLPFVTKIFFTKPLFLDVILPELKKYEAYLENGGEKKIVALSL